MKKISLTILFLAFFSTMLKGHILSNQKIGVIIDKIVAVKSDRNNQNITLFELHEGAIIEINKEDTEWANISVDKDKTGWVSIKSIRY